MRVSSCVTVLLVGHQTHTGDSFKVRPQLGEEQVDFPSNETVGDEFGELAWGLLIDGKDASGGSQAFGSSFQQPLDSLNFVLEQTVDDDLTIELILDIQRHCCSKFVLRGGHGGGKSPLSDFGPGCFKSMGCQARQDAIATIPPSMISITIAHYCPLLYAVPKVMHHNSEIVGDLTSILNTYHEASRSAPRQDKPQQTLILARFLKKFAWLHPFTDGNGRLRTLIAQREIRHRGLGRGAFMYNNNRDVFFISDEMYAAKIDEGIQMADLARETHQNPWTDEAHVKAHFDKFPSSGHCHDGGGWGSVAKIAS